MSENSEQQQPVPVTDEKLPDRIRLAEAETTVKTCAAVAAVIGLVPLPLADAPLIIITQIVMIRKLCGRYGRQMGYSLALVLISAMIGPEFFKALLKLIPGLGSIAGALVAGTCTWAVGRTILTLLEQDKPFSFKNLKDSFLGIFKKSSASL